MSEGDLHNIITVNKVADASLLHMRVPILMYHSISDHASARFREFTVSPSLFSEHISYLEQHHYTPLTVSQFVRSMRDVSLLPELPIVLTFDDGFADFYTGAYPVLQSHGFRASLYIITSYVGKTSRWLRREAETDRPMLDWGELRDLNSNGIECGAHTHHHLQLDTQSTSVARYEITRSKAILEEHLRSVVETFAYPFGYYSSATRQLVIEAGYTSACAVRYTLSAIDDDPYALARIKIEPDTTTNKLDTLLKNAPSSLAVMYKQSRSRVWRFVRCSAMQLRNAVNGTTNVN